MSDDVDVVRRLFDAVEARDLDRVLDCYSDDVEIAEAEVLPYGGVWGDGAGTVCAVFHHRARDRVSGERFDAPEVGIYRIRDGRVAASQMFHADSAAVIRFLSEALVGNDDPPAQP